MSSISSWTNGASGFEGKVAETRLRYAMRVCGRFSRCGRRRAPGSSAGKWTIQTLELRMIWVARSGRTDPEEPPGETRERRSTPKGGHACCRSAAPLLYRKDTIHLDGETVGHIQIGACFFGHDSLRHTRRRVDAP